MFDLPPPSTNQALNSHLSAIESVQTLATSETAHHGRHGGGTGRRAFPDSDQTRYTANLPNTSETEHHGGGTGCREIIGDNGEPTGDCIRGSLPSGAAYSLFRSNNGLPISPNNLLITLPGDRQSSADA
jgi:hypothetical protein